MSALSQIQNIRRTRDLLLSGQVELKTLDQLLDPHLTHE